MSLNTLCSRIMLYTGLESVLYQILLCAHQICLFRTIDTSLYGQIGALFSCIFLLALYSNAGLDGSLASLYSLTLKSKRNFRRILGKQIIISCITIPAILAIIYLIIPKSILPVSLHNFKNMPIVTITMLLICIESIKKTIRTLLHLMLLQKVVAFVEIATLCGYIATVWGYLLSGKAVSIETFFLPMLFSSGTAFIIYGVFLFRSYKKISDIELSDTYVATIPSWQTIVSMRLKNWLYQIAHSLYSSNFLVISIAQLYGFELAALLKIISFCTYSINYIVQHIFGIACNVLFAHAKGRGAEEMQHIFTTVRSRLYYTLILCPFIILGYQGYAYIYHPHLCFEHAHIISLFMLLLLSENISVAHEQYYIVHDRTGLLIACNLGLLFPSLILHYNICANSPTILLYMLLAVRASCFILLMYADRFLHFLNLLLFKKYKLLFAQK